MSILSLISQTEMKRILPAILILTFTAFSSWAGDFQPDEIIRYKETPMGDLNLHVFYPGNIKQGDNRPAIVFFFGGGWTSGTPRQFYAHCEYLAAQGMVAISAEYRVKGTHGTTPVESVKDGKSAIRWVRKHAEELGVDPLRIAASGGSAGGHVAACTALIEGLEEEDPDICSVPDAMVLFNPVPFSQVSDFQLKMSEHGNLCVLIPSVGQGHGFFNSRHFRENSDNTYFKKSIYETHFFLQEIGFLDHLPEEWVNRWPDDLRETKIESRIPRWQMHKA